MSKATNENYIIRIKSYIDQFDSEGNTKEEDRDHIELMTRGNLVKKGESFYITYKETQTIGFEGCTTTIKIAEDGSRVALLRFGRTNSQLLAVFSYLLDADDARLVSRNTLEMTVQHVN